MEVQQLVDPCQYEDAGGVVCLPSGGRVSEAGLGKRVAINDIHSRGTFVDI